ncbi:MAG: hypothetical protein WBH31_09085 [Promethearchaeia archaeon]
MEHILYDTFIFGSYAPHPTHLGHLGDFAKYGYDTKEEIAELILKTIHENDYYMYLGRHTYRIETKSGETIYIGIIISSNGYIINAHPWDRDQDDIDNLNKIFQEIDDYFNFKLFNNW